MLAEWLQRLSRAWTQPELLMVHTESCESDFSIALGPLTPDGRAIAPGRKARECQLQVKRPAGLNVFQPARCHLSSPLLRGMSIK